MRWDLKVGEAWTWMDVEGWQGRYRWEMMVQNWMAQSWMANSWMVQS